MSWVGIWIKPSQGNSTQDSVFLYLLEKRNSFFLLYSKLGRYKSKSSRDHELERGCLRMTSMQRTMEVKK